MRQIARTLAVFLAALSLTLQANAPVQAAMMAAGSDLPANLCASHTPGQDHRSPADRDAACAACAVCVGGSEHGHSFKRRAGRSPGLRRLRARLAARFILYSRRARSRRQRPRAAFLRLTPP